MKTKPATVLIALLLGIAACATAPRTPAERDALATSAEATLQTMRAADPDLQSFLDRGYGYAVFPEIGKGGLIAGAAYGRGVLYEQGRLTGYVELNQGSLGAQIGAQTFAELIVFRNKLELDRLKAGNFSVSGNASAVALTEGASASARFVDGVAVFTMPRGGIMAELSVSGQQINYQPLGG
jgi:lipid-binding SYLF domain-containing protein